MDKLWAPWRIKYIRANNKKRCIFCQAKKKEGSDYVFLKTAHSLAMLNIFPYNNGHAMVAPLKHVKDLDALNEAEILDLVSTLQKTKKLLKKVLQPQGYNIGINLSAEAGAGIPEHLHIHIVPRWKGDTNFMPIIFKTKVISQSLAELFKQLKKCSIKQR